MEQLTYSVTKACVYKILDKVAHCDHIRAKANGYIDGWQMLLDAHDRRELTAFCGALPYFLTTAQCRVLLDGLAQEYGHSADWLEFVESSCKYPNWLPSLGPAP